MIEFDLPNDHPLVVNLEDMLAWLHTSNVPNRIVGEPDKHNLTEAHLKDMLENKPRNYCRFARFESDDGYDFKEIEKHSAELYEEKSGNKDYTFISVAKTWYPPNGYLGWHIDQTGDRLYSSYAEGKSFFRYRDPDTKEIITSWDKPNQWMFRIFSFNPENPMWHCVSAEDLRVSVGYRFVLN